MTASWLPRQHGAWAMLVVPLVAGAIVRTRDGLALPPWLGLLALTALVGYLAFNAASIYAKAPTVRKAEVRLPVEVYGLATLLLGLATVLVGPVVLLRWVPVYLVLVTACLWLAAKHKDRSLASGVLSVVAASGLVLVMSYPDPLGIRPGRALLVACVLAVSFVGTVLYVKTNIRERGNVGYLRASVGWHVAATLAAIPFGWPWMAFFALSTLRAAILPGRRLSPKDVGLIEAGLCVVLLLVVALA